MGWGRGMSETPPLHTTGPAGSYSGSGRPGSSGGWRLVPGPRRALATGGQWREAVFFDVGGFEGVVGVGGAAVDAADRHNLPGVELVANIGCHTGEVPAAPPIQPAGGGAVRTRPTVGGAGVRFAGCLPAACTCGVAISRDVWRSIGFVTTWN